MVTVVITETLKRFVQVDTDSEIEALEKVRGMYERCEIVLDWQDFAELDLYAQLNTTRETQV